MPTLLENIFTIAGHARERFCLGWEIWRASFGNNGPPDSASGAGAAD